MKRSLWITFIISLIVLVAIAIATWLAGTAETLTFQYDAF